MDDVVLEQLNPLINFHLIDFFGTQISQRHAGLMQSRQFLTLLGRFGGVDKRNDQLFHFLVFIHHRSDAHHKIAVADLNLSFAAFASRDC